MSARLPDKLSGLLRMAIRDGRCLNREVYYPDATEWHEPDHSFCSVCLAGAVMATEFDLPPGRRFTPAGNEEFDAGGWEPAFRALDALRRMEWEDAVYWWDMAAKYAGGPTPPRGLIPEAARLTLTRTDFAGWDSFHMFLDSAEDLAAALEREGW